MNLYRKKSSILKTFLIAKVFKRFAPIFLNILKFYIFSVLLYTNFFLWESQEIKLKNFNGFWNVPQLSPRLILFISTLFLENPLTENFMLKPMGKSPVWNAFFAFGQWLPPPSNRRADRLWLKVVALKKCMWQRNTHLKSADQQPAGTLKAEKMNISLFALEKCERNKKSDQGRQIVGWAWGGGRGVEMINFTLNASA